MQTVVETWHYASRAEQLLTVLERDAVINAIATAPLKGNLIKDTGGVRKLRFAKGGRGKRGGVRVGYFYYNASSQFICWRYSVRMRRIT